MKKKSWQEELKEENERLLFANRELRAEVALLSREIELLKKYSSINPDLVETISRFSISVGDSMHAMNNFLNSVERTRR